MKILLLINPNGPESIIKSCIHSTIRDAQNDTYRDNIHVESCRLKSTAHVKAGQTGLIIPAEDIN